MNSMTIAKERLDCTLTIGAPRKCNREKELTSLHLKNGLTDQSCSAALLQIFKSDNRTIVKVSHCLKIAQNVSGFQKTRQIDHYLAFLMNFCPLKM